jgi:pentatricopeptide repeat protein
MNGLKLRVLEKTAPQEAEMVARQLLADSPGEARYWWHLAAILRTQERHTEAAQVARKAVDLNPEGWYRPRLANCLGKAGDLEAAEKTYDEMLERHPERPLYWYWYAEFLLDYFPDRIEEASAAAKQAIAPSDSDWSVSLEDVRALEARLVREPVAP